MKKVVMRSWARYYEDLPKIPTMVTRNYNRSPHQVRFKTYCEWGLDKKRLDAYVNPEFADIFGMTRDEVIENNKKIELAAEFPNPYRDVLL